MITDLDNPNQTFNIDAFQFTPTGFSTSVSQKDLSFDDWQRVGEFIRLSNAASQWWWGDWMNLGEDVFGEKSSQALEITRWDEETLRVYAWVCRNVPPVKRLTGVSFSHYILLAKLSIAQQQEWASKVLEHQWSQRQLRKALRSANTEASKMQACVLIRCKDKDQVAQVTMWANMNELEFEECERATK